ncbi:SDR family oxidoreductase [Streptomyces sp. 71268]|uniref:SDR family oxidoreductase n=1 Tax=Streptomyces sp. 71268 TaxID=3002640 RepID=UPI0023F7CBC1|nr:SDR family oxidoreductase [Streptomyces sp. 71268]WEV28968.1 SDR family oxidoreductase [Streptomyces sp. 71268]
MRVFVTGATGYIGSAVVRELIATGHEVVGLARTDTAAAALTTAGAAAHRGCLGDLDSLRAGAAAADGVIHLAFSRDLSDYVDAGKLDVGAVEALGAALAGTGKPLVVTSATLLLAMVAPGCRGTEEVPPVPGSTAPRIAAENAVMALAEQGVRASVVRLAPAMHGEGGRGLISRLVDLARERGVSAYVGDGANRWPAVHRWDAARLFRLAVEAAPARSILHGVAEEGVPLRAIAEVIGRRLRVPVVSLTPAEAGCHFEFLADLVSLDNLVSSDLTRQRLGWTPAFPALLPDLEADPRLVTRVSAPEATDDPVPCEGQPDPGCCQAMAQQPTPG